jgi:excinuclease ABC subunit B
MYADNMTAAMTKAIDETNRRRAKQVAYNLERGVDPQPLRKKISDITDLIAQESDDTDDIFAGLKGKRSATALPFTSKSSDSKNAGSLPRQELIALIGSLTEQMRSAADQLQFELAARLRDELKELKRELRGMDEAGT